MNTRVIPLLLIIGLVKAATAFVIPGTIASVDTRQKNGFLSDSDSGVVRCPMSPTSDENMEDEGYSLVGTLSRQGPIPAFVRITQPEKYQQAVDKFMLQEQCSRTQAQANMDAYFNDPNGWLLSRKQFENEGIPPPDYVNANQTPLKLGLTLFWGTLSTFYIWRIYAYVILGIDYKDNLLGF